MSFWTLGLPTRKSQISVPFWGWNLGLIFLLHNACVAIGLVLAHYLFQAEIINVYKWFIILNSDRPVIINNCWRGEECRFSNVSSDNHLASRRRTLLDNRIVTHKVKNVPPLWCQSTANALTRARQCPCPKPKGNSLIPSPFLFKTYFNVDRLSIYANIPYVLYSLQNPNFMHFLSRVWRV